MFPLVRALTEVIIQSIWGRKRIQIRSCNSSYLSNPLQAVCSNTLEQESIGVMDRDHDDPAPKKQGREMGGSWCPIPWSPCSIFALPGGPKGGCLSLMLGKHSQAQGGIFAIILGRDRSWTSMILVVLSQLRRFCDSMILMYSFNFFFQTQTGAFWGRCFPY